MIKAIIIEDEELAAIRLQNLVQKTDASIAILKIATSVKDAVAYLRKEKVDLIFLDINLSDAYSFEIFEQIEVTTPIIFTTAYAAYAIKAFEQNSISYLLKPIDENALKKAIDKYHLFKNSRQDEVGIQDINKSGYKKRFLIKINNGLTVCNIEDVAYFYSEDKLTFIKLWNGKSLPINYSLKNLEGLVDPIHFFRINRQYIVHSKSIEKMYYASKSKIKINLKPENKNGSIFVAIEKIGDFKKWLSF